MLSKRQQLLLGSAIVISSAPAFAYIDPGTGSALIQGIIAAIAAIGVSVKLYWHRIVKFIARKDLVDDNVDGQSDE